MKDIFLFSFQIIQILFLILILCCLFIFNIFFGLYFRKVKLNERYRVGDIVSERKIQGPGFSLPNRCNLQHRSRGKTKILKINFVTKQIKRPWRLTFMSKFELQCLLDLHSGMWYENHIQYLSDTVIHCFLKIQDMLHL